MTPLLSNWSLHVFMTRRPPPGIKDPKQDLTDCGTHISSGTEKHDMHQVQLFVSHLFIVFVKILSDSLLFKTVFIYLKEEEKIFCS